MIHTQRLTLNTAGLQSQRASLRTVAIYQESPCWAMALKKPAHAFKEGYRSQLPHMILSPIHPSAWPYLVRLKVVIEDRAGALEQATAAANAAGLNILTSECLPAGYRHSIWSAIGLCVRDPVLSIRPFSEEPSRASPWTDKEVKHLCLTMIHCAREIEASVLAAGVKGKWLRRRHVDGIPAFLLECLEGDAEVAARELSSRLRELGREDDVDWMRLHVTQPVESRWMSRMAYYAISAASSPIRFELVGDQLNEVVRGGDSWRSLADIDVQDPSLAIGSFHTRDKYVRIEPVSKNNLVRVSVAYRAEGQLATASRGFLSSLLASILKGDRRPNVLYQSQKLVALSETGEEGEIRVVAELVNESSSALEERLAQESFRNVRVSRVTCSPVGCYKLFISSKIARTGSSASWLLECAKQVAREVGFELVSNETSTGSVTSLVRESLNEAQAVLMIAAVLEPDDSSPGHRSFSWLHTEYGMALAMDKLSARLIDESLPHYEFPQNADHPLLVFSLSDKKDARNKITRALRELFDKIVMTERQ